MARLSNELDGHLSQANNAGKPGFGKMASSQQDTKDAKQVSQAGGWGGDGSTEL